MGQNIAVRLVCENACGTDAYVQEAYAKGETAGSAAAQAFWDGNWSQEATAASNRAGTDLVKRCVDGHRNTGSPSYKCTGNNTSKVICTNGLTPAGTCK